MCVSVRVRMLSIECLAGQCSRNGAVFCVKWWGVVGGTGGVGSFYYDCWNQMSPQW